MKSTFVKSKFSNMGKNADDFCLILKSNKSFSRGDALTGNDFQFIKIKNRSFKEKLFLILSGMVIGLLNGFFGGGGGMVCVPILQHVLKLESKESHATAILVILPISLISAFIYVYKGYISTYPLLIVSGGVILGGVIGSYALKFLPPKAIKIIFAIVMFAGGIKLII